jgi:D-sedoheptulose 7-phosphate isomerase
MKAELTLDVESVVRARLGDSVTFLSRLLETQMSSIVAAGRLLAQTISGGKKILFCGNGGSAADSQHLATEFVVRLSASFVRPALAAIAITTDSSLLTACANDFGFEQIFERQVEALGKPGDALVGITTSGRSKNVVRALAKARELGLKTVLLSAGDGADCAPLADVAVLAPAAKDPGLIQECHIATGHVLAELVERLACGRT